MQEFHAWCKARNVKFPKCLFVNNGNNGRSVIATSQISAGEVVVEVPDDAVLTTDTTSISQLLSNAGLSPPVLSPLHHVVGLIISIMAEKLAGTSSEWFDYLSIIPSELPHLPIFWAEQAIQELAGTSAFDKLSGIYRRPNTVPTRVVELYASVVAPFLAKHMNDLGGQHDQLESGSLYDLYLWATGVVSSYSFTLGDTHIPAMVPVWDLLNHITGKKNVRLYHCEKRHVLQMIATEHIDVNSEIVNDYGPLSNADLLLSYGFVEEHNPYIHASIPLVVLMAGIWSVKSGWRSDECQKKACICTISCPHLADSLQTVGNNKSTSQKLLCSACVALESLSYTETSTTENVCQIDPDSEILAKSSCNTQAQILKSKRFRVESEGSQQMGCTPASRNMKTSHLSSSEAGWKLNLTDTSCKEKKSSCHLEHSCSSACHRTHSRKRGSCSEAGNHTKPCNNSACNTLCTRPPVVWNLPFFAPAYIACLKFVRKQHILPASRVFEILPEPPFLKPETVEFIRLMLLSPQAFKLHKANTISAAKGNVHELEPKSNSYQTGCESYLSQSIPTRLILHVLVWVTSWHLARYPTTLDEDQKLMMGQSSLTPTLQASLLVRTAEKRCLLSCQSWAIKGLLEDLDAMNELSCPQSQLSSLVKKLWKES